MRTVVKAVTGGSPASRTIITPGDRLKRVNGHTITDVLDYMFYSYDRLLRLEFLSADGKIKLVRIKKTEGADLGLEFDSFLMDGQRSCANKCVFCFIDQLPDGMRETLYYKDDDVRLSFLQGNYITLTNLAPREVERIIKLRISPVNISVHTTNPVLRSHMLGSKRGGDSLLSLYEFARAGITMNCQIVCCPGINDGDELRRTIRELYALGPCVNSVSIVPVGLTKHRSGLAPLRIFDRELALETVKLVDTFGDWSLKKRGSRVFYCADEFYIKAELALPENTYYDNYPQLENGVGMMRLLITEFEDAVADTPDGGETREPFSIATGVAAEKYLTNLLNSAAGKYDNIDGRIYAVKNEFFGDNIDVAGLVTGGDIIRQLSGREFGSRLLIPVNMLRSGEAVFLDGVTVDELSKKLGVEVRVVKQDGEDLLLAFLGK